VSRSRYVVREGIVIRRTPLPSGDVVATLLSTDGKWRAVARKGKRMGGNPGRLSLFHDVTVQTYSRNNDDLAVVAQVTLNGVLASLADAHIYPYASLLAELADRLATDVHHGEPLHAWLASGLRGLNQDADPDRVALVHAWMMLRIAGFAPDVQADLGESARLDVAGGHIQEGGSGLTLQGQVARDLVQLTQGRARDTLTLALEDRKTHWQLLDRYAAWHVSELKSVQMIVPSVSRVQP
jgi:recombinational DNA repair protein (RecF pathway)